MNDHFTLEEILKTADLLIEKQPRRWSRCVRNHLTLAHVDHGLTGGIFVPIKYVAHALGGGDFDAEKIQPTAKLLRATEAAFRENDYQLISPSDSDFERVFLEYVNYSQQIPGPMSPEFVKSRRRYVGNGNLRFWCRYAVE